MRISLTQNHPALFIAIFLLIYVTPLSATTVVVAFNANGIVIASDSKGSLISSVGKVGEIQHRKIHVIQGRFAIACAGVCGYSFSSTRSPSTAIERTFDTWIIEIERSLKSNISFDDFAGIIEKEVKAGITALDPVLKGGGIKQENPFDGFEPYYQYIIVGFEQGLPRLFVFDVDIDFQTLQIRLYATSAHPETLQRSGSYFFGIREAIADITDRHSYAYRQAMSSVPDAFKKLIGHQLLSLDETSAILREAVRVEEQTNPRNVGGEVQVVEVLPSGAAYDVLPKGTPTKQTTKQK
jgi:hypothetical protein